MRIVAGRYRGCPIRVPAGVTVRPSSDRLRQAVFNILDHGGAAVPYADLPVIDLFAGTGAFGLEALSRCAAFATFVDTDQAALQGIRRNAAALGETRIALLRLDAANLKAPPDRVAHPAAVAFLDPPYGSTLVVPALERLQAYGWLQKRALVVVEIAAVEPLAPPATYAVLDERTYGAGRAVFLQLK